MHLLYRAIKHRENTPPPAVVPAITWLWSPKYGTVKNISTRTFFETFGLADLSDWTAGLPPEQGYAFQMA
jgi:hypothetical protein